MENEIRTPTPIDIFDQSLASLRELWSDSPETYAMVVDAVCKREELLESAKKFLRFIAAHENKEVSKFWFTDQAKELCAAIAKAEGK